MKKCFSVVHLTSVHRRYDSRIFIKMCSTLALASNDFNISLIVADGLGDEVRNLVSIIDVGPKIGGRLSRMTKTVIQVYIKAKNLDADIYHLHDPELLPLASKLKKLGKIVIFDWHEDVPKQLLGKPYLNFFIRNILSKIFGYYETLLCPKLDAVITATPYIRDKFSRINSNTIDINNFPKLEEFTVGSDWSKKENEVAYIGTFSKIRGIEEIVNSMSYTEGVRLNLGGIFCEKKFENKVKKNIGWSKVNELGFLDRTQINCVLSKSKVGLVILHPAVNYLESFPVKMFEYMATGIPVICSNFPLFCEIIQSNHCGICVDPLNPKVIGETIQFLIDHPNEAEKMGRNGRQAVEQKYNWAVEEGKLLDLYRSLSS